MSKDVADLFAAERENARPILEGLKSQAYDALDRALSEVPQGSTRDRYRYAKGHVAPLLLRLEEDGERSAAVEDAAQALKIKAGEIRKLLKAETRDAEAVQPVGEDVPRPGTERYERAVELLSSHDLLARAASDMERLGHVGEHKTKQLALVCALSARAGNPIQPSTHAQSSSGKNALWDTTLSLLPPEMVVSRSALSSKALYRTEANLKGGVLYIQELAGSEDAEDTIRVMQSGNCLEYEATEKTPDGQMRNVVHRVEGPTVIVQTTTKNHLHPENETRVFPIYIDESEQQTRLIVRSVLAEAAGNGIGKAGREAILQVWRDGVRLLEPGEMVVPFAQRIEMPTAFVRIRRDARRLLNVVRVVAWLHQRQRGRDSAGRILATEDGFQTALKLVSESLKRAWQSLTPSEQRVLEAIQKLPELKLTQGFKRRDLKVPGLSDRRIKEILKSLVDNGYLDCDFGTGPKGFTFTLARLVEEIGLGIHLRPSPDEDQTFSVEQGRTGDGAPPDHRPVEDDSASGGNGRNGLRPINQPDLQDLDAIGQSGGPGLAGMSDAVEPGDSEDTLAEVMDFFDQVAREEAGPVRITPADEFGF